MNSPLHKLKSTSKIRTTTLHKAFLAAGLLSGAALTSIVFAAPANAVDCSTLTSILDLKNAGACTAGDKTYSGFQIAGAFVGLLYTDSVLISVGAPNHTIAFSSANGWDPGTYSATYTMAVTPIPSGPPYSPYFLGYSASSSSSIFSPVLPAGSVMVTGTVLPPISAPVNGGMAGPVFYTPGTIISDTFTTKLDVTDGKVTAFDHTLTQGYSNGTQVPGPLPLLGAGAAFGFSRRIRNRIKVAA